MDNAEAHTLVVEIARAVVRAETLAIALRNIAGGHWNVAPKPGTDLTAREYAAAALRSAGLPEHF